MRKLTRNNPNRDLVNIKACAIFGQVQSLHFQVFERKRNSDINQEPVLCDKFAKIDDIPNLDLVNINAYKKFGQIPSNRSKDIERKRNSDKYHGSSRAITLLLFNEN